MVLQDKIMHSGAKVRYDVYFGTDSSPDSTELLGNQTETECDISISAGVTYFWKIVAKNAGGSKASPVWSFTVAENDTTAPTPNPMTWSTEPYATGTTSIKMVASEANDDSGVMYYFSEVYGQGMDSGWQSSRIFIATDLDPNTTYTYEVYARDNSDNLNRTSPSERKSATTEATITRLISLDGDLDFGSVTVGSTATRTLTISNTGNSTLNVSGISYPSGFSGNWNDGPISAGGSRDVTVTFAPTAATSYGGTITVSSDKTGGTNTRSCSGTGTAVPTYTVSYDANEATSGTAPEAQTKTHDEALTLASNSGSLVRMDYIFAGWNTASDGSGTDYAAGGSYTVNASVTLYAKWTPAPVVPFTYTTINNRITITGYTGGGGAVSIPDTIDGVQVFHIGVQAFENCTSLTSVRIPDGVISIAYRAFKNCTSLTSITIPGSVTYRIGDGVFSGCTSLTSITIGTGVTTITENMFENCTSLTSVTMPDGVIRIEYRAFDNCTSLTSITIPDSVTSIGQGVFSGCSSLTSVAIGTGVTSIRNDSFENCTSLTAIMVDEGNADLLP